MADKVRAARSPLPASGRSSRSRSSAPAHALLQAEPLLGGATGTRRALYGDVPLLSTDTLRRLIAHHQATGAAATVLTAHVPNPTGYGRIVRDATAASLRIVEERDASPAERAITEINSGIYAFDARRRSSPRFTASTPQNAQGEYYLTDLVGIFRARRPRVETLCHRRRRRAARHQQPRRAGGDARHHARRSATQALMAVGRHAARSGDDLDRRRRRDRPGHRRSTRTSISKARPASARDCEIHAGVRIVDSTLADDVVVQNYCVIRESTVDAGVTMGPFSHIRPDSHARGRRARRQLRRAEEGAARRRAPRPVTWPISATRPSARRSTSAPARSPATTTARRSTRRSSTTAPSSAATRSWSRR